VVEHKGKVNMLEPCNLEVYNKGGVVFTTDTISPYDLDPWVQKVAALSGEPVDWHCDSGQMLVKTTGDIERVYAALCSLLLEHDDMWYDAANKYQVTHNIPPGFPNEPDAPTRSQATKAVAKKATSRFDLIG
jgi:hypothetical protein